MKVQFRNIQLKVAKSEKAASSDNSSGNTKQVVLIAGTKSHGYGSHEHRAGCMLLAKALNESGLPVEAQVVTEGWPKDASVLDGADTIIIYADGGGRHPFNAHIEEIDALMKKGVGLVCIHYGVEIPKGKSGNAFLDWTGGYFETDWSALDRKLQEVSEARDYKRRRTILGQRRVVLPHAFSREDGRRHTDP